MKTISPVKPDACCSAKAPVLSHEAIILRKVLKPRLIAVFFAVVAGGIILVGFLFNLLIH